MEDILVYGYSEYGEEQARSYVQSIYEKLNMLLEFPYLGHRRGDMPDTHLAIRVEKDHIAVYRIAEQTIHIVRILYSGFDFTLHTMQ